VQSIGALLAHGDTSCCLNLHTKVQQHIYEIEFFFVVA
jgi:hypothetical protein